MPLIVEHNKKLQVLANNIKSFTQEYIRAIKTLEVGDNVVKHGLDKHTKIAGQSYADSAIKSTYKIVNKVEIEYEGLLREIELIFENVAEPYYDALSLELYREAIYWLNYVKNIYVYMQKLDADIKASGMDRNNVIEIQPIPVSILRTEAEIKRQISASQICLNSALSKMNVNINASYNEYGYASSIDKSNYRAQIGRGFCKYQKQTKAMSSYSEYYKLPIDDKISLLQKELDAKGYYLLLAELNQYTGKTQKYRSLPSKVGTSTGLSVSDMEGKFFPVSVEIKNVLRRTKEAMDNIDGPWGKFIDKNNMAINLHEYPISFGDYGDKDVFMFISAIEAYKWLSSNFPEQLISNNNNGLYINFHNLTGSKGGDSAGVTIATASYSSLFKKPLLSNVAITGSIRGDGTVKAVGGIPEKIQAGYDSGQIEIVVIPKENEAMLAMIPLDQLLRLMIVTASDIKEYLEYTME